MKNGVIFLAGIYGTGKTTVGKELSARLGLPCFQASELITERNDEQYGATKHVKDVKNNQDILAEAVADLREKYEAFILTGHFAIFNKTHEVVEIPQEVFGRLGLSAIVLLETTVDKAIQNISGRDGKEYAAAEITALAQTERRLAEQAAAQNGIPLFTRQMDFNTDGKAIEKYLLEERK
ncbi:MAG: AAA family ATPase [Bacteroidales bacterium]|jgi:adenylate kinase|nr:AAA family ATPase [Bacteroidales bacterium]